MSFYVYLESFRDQINTHTNFTTNLLHILNTQIDYEVALVQLIHSNDSTLPGFYIEFKFISESNTLVTNNYSTDIPCTENFKSITRHINNNIHENKNTKRNPIFSINKESQLHIECPLSSIIRFRGIAAQVYGIKHNFEYKVNSEAGINIDIESKAKLPRVLYIYTDIINESLLAKEAKQILATALHPNILDRNTELQFKPQYIKVNKFKIKSINIKIELDKGLGVIVGNFKIKLHFRPIK